MLNMFLGTKSYGSRNKFTGIQGCQEGLGQPVGFNDQGGIRRLASTRPP